MDSVNGIPIIDDTTPDGDFLRRGVAYGLIPRDYSVDPIELFAPPDDMAVYQESDWDALWEEQVAQKSSLRDIYDVADGGKQPANLYQNGDPFCWAHSTTNAVMVARAVAGFPYEPLSAYMVACLAANYRITGGWCGQSAKLIAEIGVCSQKFWAQQNRSRKNDTPEMRANAARHRITDEWRDLTRPIHGQRMTFAQVATCGFNRQPQALDFNWWGHSVCGMGLYRIERGSWGTLILNSHGDRDGDRGYHILRGNRAVPDGAIAIRSVMVA